MVKTVADQLDELEMMDEWNKTGERKWSKEKYTVKLKETEDSDRTRYKLLGFVGEVRGKPKYSLGRMTKDELEDALKKFISKIEKS